MTIDNKTKLKIYYNSACPVCDAGINHQKKKMVGCDIVWNDVHSNIAARSDLDADLEFIRKRLHVVDKHGDVKVGIDAFITLWEASVGDEWKAKLCSLTLIHPCLDITYNLFSGLLYRWNKLLNHW